jgi:SAM-dependent methyltransferase
VTCTVCGGRSLHEFYKQGLEIRKCQECGLAFWRAEDDFEPERIYDHDYFASANSASGYDDYGVQEAVMRRNFARRLRSIEGSGRLLDIGAAYGFGVSEAERLGWAATGLEVSASAARHASDRTAVRVVRGSGTRLPFRTSSFDAVAMWDVLEHLADPHGAVGEAARVLRTGGQLVLTTGDRESFVARISGRRWHLYTLPEHLFFYSRKSLAILLARHGLEVESIRAEASHYTLGYLVERLRKVLLGRRATRPARWPGAELPIPVNLFDIVTVHAVRQEA